MAFTLPSIPYFSNVRDIMLVENKHVRNWSFHRGFDTKLCWCLQTFHVRIRLNLKVIKIDYEISKNIRS